LRIPIRKLHWHS